LDAKAGAQEGWTHMGTAADREKEALVRKEVDAIRASDKALLKAESDRDLELAMSFMAPDIVVHPPGQPAAIGLEAVREFYTHWFSLPFRAIHVQAQSVSMSSSADLAYLVGESSIEMSGSQDGLHLPGKYLGVWRKIDGEWRLSAIGWSANAAQGDAR
jgi:ketosteroid isomerase-like protein